MKSYQWIEWNLCYVSHVKPACYNTVWGWGSLGLVKVWLVSPNLLWKSGTYSYPGREQPQILLLFIPGFASMLGLLIYPQVSVYRYVWISPLMANAAGVTEGKLAPLPALFPFCSSSSSFLTHLVSLWLVFTLSRCGTNQALCCLLERPLSSFEINGESGLMDQIQLCLH